MTLKHLTLVILAVSVMGVAASAATVTISPFVDADTLAAALSGSGVTIASGSATYTGAAAASGTFTGGIAAGIGIESGVILTTGAASVAPGPNNSDSDGVSNGLAGDAALTALAGVGTFDATILEFDFETTTGDLFFKYVFASEEYNEYANSNVNDTFAFFVDGVNVALIPSTSTAVSINTVNGGDPLGSGAVNPAFFINNDLDDGGPFFDIQYDGFTTVFTASALGLSTGTHTIRLAIADGGDYIYDSAVFIEGSSFSGTNPAAVPLPGAGLAGFALLLGLGATRQIRRRRQQV